MSLVPYVYISWRRKWQPTLVSVPGKFHGQRSLVGYSPWDCERVGHNLATEQQEQHIYIERERERKKERKRENFKIVETI